MFNTIDTDDDSTAAGLAGHGLSKIYPAGRIGHSSDIGMLVLLLCSPATAWTTGTVVPVDGGLGAYCRM